MNLKNILYHILYLIYALLSALNRFLPGFINDFLKKYNVKLALAKMMAKTIAKLLKQLDSDFGPLNKCRKTKIFETNSFIRNKAVRETVFTKTDSDRIGITLNELKLELINSIKSSSISCLLNN